MSIHRFQSDPAAPTFCKCGYHHSHRIHAVLDIDALPDLYEASKSALLVLTQCHCDESVPVHKAIQKLDAALQKAEGR